MQRKNSKMKRVFPRRAFIKISKEVACDFVGKAEVVPDVEGPAEKS